MRNKYLSYVKSSAVNSELEQTNKFSLQMFYTAELENVYYSEKSDCFIVADIENNNVYLHSVLYKNYIPLFLNSNLLNNIYIIIFPRRFFQEPIYQGF